MELVRNITIDEDGVEREWKLTLQLRWHGDTLQQLWMDELSTKSEWRDVPHIKSRAHRMIEPAFKDQAEAEQFAENALKHFPALKPCPFCGCEAWLHTHGRVFREGQRHGHRIECEGDCHAMTCYWHRKEEAISNWNRRVV